MYAEEGMDMRDVPEAAQEDLDWLLDEEEGTGAHDDLEIPIR